MRPFRLTLTLVAAIALVIAVAACGSSGSSSSSTAAGSSSSGTSSSSSGLSLAGLADTKQSSTQKMGGTLHVISNEGWEHLDPGASYFQIDYLVVNAVQTPLYMFTPQSKIVPVLASGPPQISSDGKTVTIHIKPNFKWSPPLNRAITSKDVAYAFQRDFNPNVQNGYAAGYYPIVGAAKAAGKPIPGISTPNNTTIVFHLTQDFGATFYQALTLPGSAPVPPEIATADDKSSPSKYDQNPTKQAFSGPYMIQSYSAGRNITLVRNPNWSHQVDGLRPAYADKIVWNAGADATVAARQTLASTDLLMADGPPAAVLKTAYESKKSQLSVSPLGTYYASLNTSVPPFNNINLRKAVIAAQNREAYLLARGGKLVGQVATHFIYPEVPGYAQAGGAAGFGQDYVSHPTGDMAVATKYMKLAGYPSGKYTGSANVLIVGSNSDPGPQEMQIVQNGLQALGFKTTIKAVPQQTMYSKFCGYVKAHINVCPTAGWIEDFPDPYAALYVPFSGKTIVPINNVNWAVLNDPKVNNALDSAAAISNPSQRLAAFAQADKAIVDDAPAIPEIWSSNALVKGTQVHGVLDVWNDDWDLSFSSTS
ncbi:MAG TPA: ABC transporter substrate-binding protein [Solirubrobacteraceae bacterium]|nr:ABC transporter substrate-binding protein [Solirubrobacteraceae bacterium]